ncbi:hypothetical protein SSAG_01879 [Streptomyces sp. Mg1]|nr:hypothetical protein SSAG_01879 [Streptomyces sp. Mg1]
MRCNAVMETATSLAIAQLSQYLRALTGRLDPRAGWYGEFLRRDPAGMRACLDGTAMPPWDVVESLLGDAGADDREARYAALLRAAAVTAWDARPGGAQELRTLLAAAVAERAASEAALRDLTARLAAAPGPPEAESLGRELAWTRDDAARAAARCEDLTHRLKKTPLPPPVPASPPTPAPVGPVPGRATSGRQRRVGSESGADDAWPEVEVPPPPVGDGVAAPVGRAEGRWLRGGPTRRLSWDPRV